MRDFEFSAGWQRQLFPRRGSLGAGPFSPLKGARPAVEGELRDDLVELRQSLATAGEPALGEAGLAWLDGDRGATPLGAAVVAAVVLNRYNQEWRKAPFADLWIAEHGVAFAAEAAVELMALTLDRSVPGWVHRMSPTGQHSNWWNAPHLYSLLRVRAALAVVPEAEYASVVAVLGSYRSGHAYHRLATSILAPGQAGWVDADVADTVAAEDFYRAFALTQALTGLRQLEDLDTAFAVRWSFRWAVTHSHAHVATMVDGVGAAILPTLLSWLDTDSFDSDRNRRLPALVAQFPSDEAMSALIDRIGRKYVPPALQEAVERFPERAVRLLAGAGSQGLLAEMLRAHVLHRRDLATGVVPQLTGAAASRVQTLLDAADTLTEAPVEALPALLVSPPWQNRVKAPRPVVVPGLACSAEACVTWREGEQETFARLPRNYDVYRTDPATAGSWEDRAAKVGAGNGYWYDDLSFFLEAPDAVARRVLSTWSPSPYADRRELSPLVARFGTDALPALIRRTESSAAEAYPVLAPLFSPELAVRTADWLARLKSARATATAWLLRHAAPASLALVPAALGKAGVARRQAENALVLIGSRGQEEAVRAAAESYGPQAAAAIGELLARDPLTVLPAKIPANPSWAAAGLLPPVRLRDGCGVLPLSAVEHLVTVFALSRLDQPYAGLDIVREILVPEDLSRFAGSLFDRWFSAGAEAKENWALDGLGLVGDDEVVRRLTPLILAWPGEGGHARAVVGVNVLAAIGSDVALMHLHTIAQRAKFRGLKSAAQEKMAAVAADLGLTSDQLADRLVPGLGLGDDGSMLLDYGPRQFVVGFDEQLRPYVTDRAGKRLKALPKPGAKDDPELAPAAHRQFSALKKDVRRVAADVILGWETAMVTGRRWSGREFRELFVGHPLLWHIVRRVVWGLYDTDGALIGTIRVAEDRTLADVTDEEVKLSDDAIVGVAHPWDLASSGSSGAEWAGVFADYEILQPFPQLSRPVHTLTAEELKTGVLTRFEGRKVPSGKVLGLERRGWHRAPAMDGGMQGTIEVSFASGLSCSIALDPGFIVGLPAEFDEQTLSMVRLHAGSAHPFAAASAGDPVEISDLVAASEILRDLTDITEVAS
ncbi:DUF4132 domain-containing protein [Kineosporia sp. NBRC 101731]|uniref:DUF4132 domain-containing protein n=1 Tax=Kineosporia sp. NBRC 101731 TaxID=3032199 RepID=UPI0024A2DCAB|nr:DUF4132 domain-containing protein [Kineosporia sp. NBRC 101731]GLY32644.1 hypothetical protein Kisp02_60090 [Kineosporia sp. NBRC 101731]